MTIQWDLTTRTIIYRKPMSDIKISSDSYLAWTQDIDEQRRCFVLDALGTVLNDTKEAEEWVQWVKNGPAKVPGSPILRPVK